MPPKPADLKKIITNDGIEPIVQAIKKLGTRVAFKGFTVKKEKLETIINLGSVDYWKKEDEDIINELKTGKTIDQIIKRTEKKREAEGKKKSVLELYEKSFKKKVNFPDKQLTEKIKEGKGVETLIIPPRPTLKDRTNIVKVRRPGRRIGADGNQWDDTTVIIPEQTFIDESEVGTKFSYGWVDDAIDDIMGVIAKKFYQELRKNRDNDGLLTEKDKEGNRLYLKEQSDKEEQIQTIKKLKAKLLIDKLERDQRKIDGRRYIEELKRDRDKGFARGNMDLDLITDIPNQEVNRSINREFNSFIDGVATFHGISRSKAITLIQNRRLKIIEEEKEKQKERIIKEKEYRLYKLLRLKNDIINDNTLDKDERDYMVFYKKIALKYLDPDFNMYQDEEDEEETNILDDIETTDFYKRYEEEIKETEAYHLRTQLIEIERQRIAKLEKKEIRREEKRKEKALAILEEAKLQVYKNKKKEERYQEYIYQYELWVDADKNFDDNPDDEFYQEAYEEEDEALNDFFSEEEIDKEWDEQFEERRQNQN